MALSVGHCFGAMRNAEKKCAASPGGTFFILLPTPALSTQGAPTQLCRKSRF